MQQNQANLIIRDMNLGDLADTHKIELESFNDAWSMNSLKACLGEPYQSLVIENKGKVIGYSIVLIVDNVADIVNLAISPDYQKQGIGTLLLQKTIKKLELFVTIVWLEVRKSNIIAQRLYENLGFTLIGRRKGYYETENGREDAFVYRYIFREE